MQYKRTQSFRPKVFKVGEIQRLIAEAANYAFNDECEVKVNITRKLPDNTELRETEKSLDALSDLCDLEKQNCQVSVYFSEKDEGSWRNYRQNAVLHLQSHHDGALWLSVDATTPEQLDILTFRLTERLGLEKETGGSGVWGNLAELEERVKSLEQQRSDSASLRCFLSFQFKGKSLEYGQKVKHFLQLLNVTVITGQGYEPQTIQAKVKKRLADIDVVVSIIVGGEPSDWIRDEMARTQRDDTFLIPLVEHGAKMVGGIYGDHEHIPFDEGHVSDAFIGLLEGITHIRNVRHEAQNVT